MLPPTALPERSTPTGPLSGVRVLDLTSVVMGPFATQILGDLGADVITVEPASGDVMRQVVAGPHPDLGGPLFNLHRNKRNVCLDLKDRAGRDALLRIAATCDVFVTNLRSGPLRRLGLDEAVVRAVRPDIIYCQANGYPSESSRADDPAYDDVIQSASGLADAAFRTTGTPAIAPTIMADKLCGLTVTYAITAALFHRERSGEGQFIEVPMLQASQAFVLVEHIGAAATEPKLGAAGYARVLNPHRGPKQTKDGWVAILPYSADNWIRILARLGRPDLASDPRLATAHSRVEHAESLYSLLGDLLSTVAAADILKFCDEWDIPAGPVSTLDEIVDTLPFTEHPITGSYRVIPTATRFSATPVSLHRHAPVIGQHGREVLSEVGFVDAEIDSLVASGALTEPAATKAD